MAFALAWAIQAQEVRVRIEHQDGESGKAFAFKEVPPPSKRDLATHATFSIVAGEEDPNSGGLARLHDGRGPAEADQPAENFFFHAGSTGGRLLVDLHKPAAVRAINTYSWHPGSRAAQVYNVYCHQSTNDLPAKKTDPSTPGWKLLASVDSRTNGVIGGQVGAAIALANPLNTRYLLLEIAVTENDDGFGNTFFSEIDVLGTNDAAIAGGGATAGAPDEFQIEGTDYSFSIDTSTSPALEAWSREKVAPMAREWYPKLVAMLGSDGFKAPLRFTIKFDPEMPGVAATGGTRIRCASSWFEKNVHGEALGAIFHELVHVVQQYGSRPQGSARPPGWLVEGIPDYIRWYMFEPQAHGAEISPRNIERARYDGKYRITANFLNWVTTRYGKKEAKEGALVTMVNASLRNGTYNDALWKRSTGHSLEELDAEWRAALTAKAEKKSAATTATCNPPG